MTDKAHIANLPVHLDGAGLNYSKVSLRADYPARREFKTSATPLGCLNMESILSEANKEERLMTKKSAIRHGMEHFEQNGHFDYESFDREIQPDSSAEDLAHFLQELRAGANVLHELDETFKHAVEYNILDGVEPVRHWNRPEGNLPFLNFAAAPTKDQDL